MSAKDYTFIGLKYRFYNNNGILIFLFYFVVVSTALQKYGLRLTYDVNSLQLLNNSLSVCKNDRGVLILSTNGQIGSTA